MQIESLARLKKELQSRDFGEVLEIAVRLAKHKVENKELLHYLLHEQQDEQGFIQVVCQEMDDAFATINDSNLYYAKKGIRRALKLVNKQIKFSSIKETEIALLMHFCRCMKAMTISWHQSKVVSNIYDRQIIRIEKAMSKLHEDLQYDLRIELEAL